MDESREGAARREDAIYKKIAWRIMPFLFVCYVVNALDRVNIGIAKLQMQGDLNFTNAAYALGASTFFWGVILFDIPSNIIMHKVGARAWIARIMISWGIVSTAVAFTQPLAIALGIDKTTVFYVLRFLLGVCEAGFYPGVVLYLSYWFPSRRQSPVLAIFLLAMPVSSVIGSLVSGWIIDTMDGWRHLQGWQWMLIVEGMPAVILGCAVLIFFQSYPDSAKWLTDGEKEIIKNNLEIGADKRVHKLTAALKDIRIWVMCAIYLPYATGVFGLAFWLPTIIHLGGIKSTFHVGVLTAIPYAGSVVAMLLHAAHSRRTGERRFHTILPILACGLGLIFSAIFAHHIPLSIFFLTIAVCGLFSFMTVFWTLPSEFLSGTAAAAGIAIVFTVGNFSGILGSFVSSLAIDITGDINSGTYVIGGLMLLSSLIAFLAPRSIFSTPLERRDQD